MTYTIFHTEIKSAFLGHQCYKTSSNKQSVSSHSLETHEVCNGQLVVEANGPASK